MVRTEIVILMIDGDGALAPGVGSPVLGTLAVLPGARRDGNEQDGDR